MKTKKFFNQRVAIVVLILLVCTICACTGGSQNQSPSPEVLPTLEPTATLSPEITPSGESAPGAVTEATPPADTNPTAEPSTSPSPQEAEAMTIRAAAEKIKGVDDVAVVVADNKKCVVALKLKPDTKLDTSIENQVKAAANKETEVKVTADETIFEEIKKIEDELLSNQPVSIEKINDAWEKIK